MKEITMMQKLKESRFPDLGQGPWSDVSQEKWDDSAWQLRHRITSLEELERLMVLTPEERAGVKVASRDKLSMAITPYFFTLIDRDDIHCPIRRQVIPRIEESLMSPEELSDPCGEEKDMKVEGLVHRYPDRVLLLTTDRCASYCRYCTRSRMVSGAAQCGHGSTDWEGAFAYLEAHEEVRDVLLSGGDPLLLSDDRLDKILTRLRQIPHLEIVRIGTRAPIFLPQRVTPALCSMLRKHAPLYVSVHINHEKELTAQSKAALERMSDHGLVTGSQTVLLRGVNNSSEAQMKLWHKLLECRVRPYYLYQCDLILGSGHFRTSVADGIEIIRQTRGFTTGYAIPQYIIDGPSGGGKIPLMPEYVVSSDNQGVVLRNYQGELYHYPEPTVFDQNRIQSAIEQAEV